ncbi:hypothetical protein QYF36_020494 [Acer negundo]|nr:hypothetical protein QYF36_020494 [Acer negundo]
MGRMKKKELIEMQDLARQHALEQEQRTITWGRRRTIPYSDERDPRRSAFETCTNGSDLNWSLQTIVPLEEQLAI